MIAPLWAIWAFVSGTGRKILTGPNGGALVAGIAVVALMVCATVWLPIRHFLNEWHDERVASDATAKCKSEQEAATLRETLIRVEAAKDLAEQTLTVRGQELARVEHRVRTRDEELEALRNELARSQGRGPVVFGADDPWLRARARREDGSVGR